MCIRDRLLDTFCEVSRDALFEDAVAVAASFACTVPDQESLLDLMFVGPRAVCVTSGRGVGHTEQMLEVLAAVSPERENRFAELESLLLQHRAALRPAMPRRPADARPDRSPIAPGCLRQDASDG